MDELKTELPNMCHLCLIAKPNMQKLPTLGLPYLNKLTTMFESITSTPLEISDIYVQQICQDCENNLHLIYKIRDDFVRANNWWRTYMASLSARNDTSAEFEVKFFPLLECFENGTEPVAVQHARPMTREMPPLLYFDTGDQEDIDALNDKSEILGHHGDPLILAQGHAKQSPELTAEFSDIIIKNPPKGPLKKARRPQAIKMYCDICFTRRNVEAVFQGKRSLRAHVKTHVNVCKICTDCFVTRSELDYHRTMCFPIKCMECDWCDTKLTKHFREHALEHHPDAVWPECEKCGAKFPHKRHLMRHWKNHMREKDFKCTYCEKAFPRAEHLRHHERVHTQERPHVCEFCAQSFAQVTSLKKHITSHANNTVGLGRNRTSKGSIYTHISCTFCEYGANNIGTLYCHMVAKHGKGAVKEANRLKGLYCVECKLFFEDRETRREHIKEHLHYKCDFCMKRFKDLDAVTIHMRRHSQTKKRPFVCDICVASFASSVNLRRHRLIHNREFLFKCDQCPKSYLEKWQLNKHIRSEHLNIRPIMKCAHCTKEFHSKQGLTYHLKMYHRSKDPI